jgi:ankyrin repeat protein
MSTRKFWGKIQLHDLLESENQANVQVSLTKEDRWGHTPLSEAERFGHTSVARLLRQYLEAAGGGGGNGS